MPEGTYCVPIFMFVTIFGRASGGGGIFPDLYISTLVRARLDCFFQNCNACNNPNPSKDREPSYNNRPHRVAAYRSHLKNRKFPYKWQPPRHLRFLDGVNTIIATCICCRGFNMGALLLWFHNSG